MKILITGVSKGLGRVLADTYMAEGHTVIGCGRDPEKILDLRFACGEGHRFDIVDVAQANKVDTPANLWEVPTKEFHQLIDVNVKGVYNVIRAFVPAMVKRGTGTIVNLSSGWGVSTSPQVAPYCASKYAIEGLSQAMAQELPDPMACIPMNPGIIATDMLATAFGDESKQYPTAEEWGKIAAPFILNLGRAQNGQSVTVG